MADWLIWPQSMGEKVALIRGISTASGIEYVDSATRACLWLADISMLQTLLHQVHYEGPEALRTLLRDHKCLRMLVTCFKMWEDRFEDSVQQPRQAEGMLRFEAAERDALFAMLRSMLSFRPESRPSAKEILAPRWMVNWALPECEKVWRG
ncbi:hypothetical protein BJX61DRAFT_547335 [Aspergillus egyptiacus]|nr:hypothetical protein BJX61DRAFT_547335 [Aspergillus egyptiacus]